MTDFDIAIIGDGFCSLMTAAHLTRSDKKVAVFGRAATQDWGTGLAYGKCHEQHLLNVASARMGAYEDAPDGFLKWLRANIDIETLTKFVNDGRPLNHAFMPRALYGQYLRSIAHTVLPKVKYFQGEVIDVEYADGMFTVFHSTGKMTARKLVLASGVAQNKSPINGLKLSDPFETDYSVFRTSKNPVVIVGTGLTMVDVISSLSMNAFKGKIHAVSRRGLLPEIHAAKDADISALVPHFRPLKGTLSQRLMAFRRNLKACHAARLPWQAYIDYLRPYVPELWEMFTPAEQDIFIRRLMPYWNTHRHRQPRENAIMIARLVDAVQLTIHKGKIPEIADASHIFNCRGTDYSLQSNPLLNALNYKGLIRAHENGMGIAIDKSLRAHGAAEGNLFIVGGMTAGTFLESTAVPELRAQCAKIAQALLQ